MKAGDDVPEAAGVRDGGWVMGRKVSQAVITGAVASALATHYSTRPETEIDIVVM